MKVHGAPWTFMRLVSAFIYTKMFYKSPWKSMDNINRGKISVWTCVDLVWTWCGLCMDFAWTFNKSPWTSMDFPQSKYAFLGILLKVHGSPWKIAKFHGVHGVHME